MSNATDKAQQRIDDLQPKLKQARALKSRGEARKRGAEAKQKRAEEMRRKILAGALALEMMDRDEGVKARFMTRPGQVPHACRRPCPFWYSATSDSVIAGALTILPSGSIKSDRIKRSNNRL